MIENEEKIEQTFSGRSQTKPSGQHTKTIRQTAVIDLEKEPEGLNDVRYCNCTNRAESNNKMRVDSAIHLSYKGTL